MKILCAGIVYNEQDVLPYTLDSAVRWADKIHVIDNGSTDGTTDLLEDYTRKYPDVISYHRDPEPYTQVTRTRAVHRLIEQAEAGDWVGLLDADEIYVDDPKDFLVSVDGAFDMVRSASIQFYLTDRDVAEWSRTGYEWSPQRSEFYLMNWSEARFVRHQPGVRWIGKWPDNLRLLKTCPRRIRLLHYQFRTPPQVAARIRSRSTAVDGFKHEKCEVWHPKGLGPDDLVYAGQVFAVDELWKARVVRADSLRRFDPASPPAVDETLLPPIPEPAQGSKRLKRLLRYGMHKLRWSSAR